MAKDLSKMSDADLDAIISGGGATGVAAMSDAELDAIIAGGNKKSNKSAARTFTDEAANAAMFGYAPQAAGLLEAPVRGLAGLFGNKPIDPKTGKPIESEQLYPEKSYLETRDKYIEEQDAASEANPEASTLGSLFGGLATAPLAFGKAASGLGSLFSKIPTNLTRNIGKSVSMANPVRNAMASGAIQGAIQNPGDEAGVVDPLQVGSRSTNAGIASILSGSMSGAGGYLSRRGDIVRASEDLNKNPEALKKNLRDLLLQSRERISKEAVGPKMREVRELVGDATVEIDPADLRGFELNEALPSRAAKYPGGRVPIMEKTADRLQRSIPTEEVVTELSKDVSAPAINYSRQATQEPLQSQLPLPRQTAVADDPFFGGLVPDGDQYRMGNIGTFQQQSSRNLPSVQYAPVAQAGDVTEQQLPLLMKEVNKRVSMVPTKATATVPVIDSMRIGQVFDDLAGYSQNLNDRGVATTSNKGAKLVADLLRRKRDEAAPQAAQAMKEAAEMMQIKSELGRGVRDPIEFFKRAPGSRTGALTQGADRLIGSDLFNQQELISTANKLNSPEFMSPLARAQQFAVTKAPGVAYNTVADSLPGWAKKIDPETLRNYVLQRMMSGVE